MVIGEAEELFDLDRGEDVRYEHENQRARAEVRCRMDGELAATVRFDGVDERKREERHARGAERLDDVERDLVGVAAAHRCGGADGKHVAGQDGGVFEGEHEVLGQAHARARDDDNDGQCKAALTDEVEREHDEEHEGERDGDRIDRDVDHVLVPRAFE